MPIVKLSMLEGRSSSEKAEIVSLIHDSLVEAFKIKENDKNYRIMEFSRENMVLPEGKSDKYVLIEMTIFPGRSTDAKRLLYRRIVERFEQIGVAPNDVFIILQEEPLDNWGIRGGHSASEIDLGFNLKV